MSSKQKAEEFLRKCQVIDDAEREKGTVVKMDGNFGFQVVHVYSKANDDWYEDLIDDFSIIDIIDEDNDRVIVNFKEIMFEILGRKHYKLERSVYRFLKKDDGMDDYYDDEFVDDAEERAAIEAAEEEEAEHQFERFLKNMENQE